MLYGIRDSEQRRLADAGHAMRVYVPFGTQWYGYFVRRLAERPANLTFFLRALAGGLLSRHKPRRPRSACRRHGSGVAERPVNERHSGA